jgi:hypothetical protein
MTKPILVLAITLDHTIVNSNTSDFNNIDYNGTTKDQAGKLKSNDFHMWLYYLNIIITAAEKRGFILVPLLITAKKNAIPDFLVARVAQALETVMRPTNKNGKATPVPVEDVSNLPSYYAMRHVDEACYKVHIPYAPDVGRGLAGSTYQIVMHEAKTDCIAPVHICHNNAKDGHEKITSKAAVLNKIEQYFEIPSENIFLLSSDAMHQIQARNAGYSPINAGKLLNLRKKTVEARSIACKAILEETQALILQRIEQIQTPENPKYNARSQAYVQEENQEYNSQRSDSNSINDDGGFNDIPSSEAFVVLGSTISPQSEPSDPSSPSMLSTLYNFFQEAHCCASTQNQIIPTGTNPSTTLG